MLGGSVFGYNNMYARLQPFLRQWRGAISAGGILPRPYIIAADMARAFDCVDSARLLGNLEQLLRAPEYTLVNYVEVGSRSFPFTGG
jgi:hypothetical protein